MIIKSSRTMNVAAFQEPITPPVQKTAVPAPTVRKSEKPQPKIVKPEVKKPKVEIKPEVKAESQVEIKEEIVEVPKKRSLLEEVLEEQAALDD